jgi:uncharacterized peroxidase-related enzyme
MKIGQAIFFAVLVSQLMATNLFKRTGSYCGIKHLFACSAQMRIVLDLFTDNRNPNELGRYLSIRSNQRRPQRLREKGEINMSRLHIVDPSAATGKAKDLLHAVQIKMGRVPNMTKAMANSPAVLEGYLGFAAALGKGLLEPKIREQLALVTAQHNRCDYCLSAHTAIGKMVGLTEEQILASREGKGASRVEAALTFATRVLDNKGAIRESDLAEVRAAGFSDGEIAEIIAHVALNVFTNYFNVATDVDIDFPPVSHSELAVA